MCRKLGTSQQVAMRRDVMEIGDMIQNQNAAAKTDSPGTLLSGSYREGFRLKESDIDTMLWRVDHRVIWELSHSQYYNMHSQTLILGDISNSPPGFTLLYLLSPSKLRKVQNACVRIGNRHYISSSKYRHIACALPSSSYMSPHGPCASGFIGPMEFDLAHCFVSDFWPPSASSWIDRCHSWPPSNIVDDIVQNGCHLVPIGHKLGQNEGNEWRISFSRAECTLVNAMNHCQFLTYGLLKLVLKEIINNGLDDGEKLLCSYHMKTAVFWAIQQNIIPHWCPQNLLDCFWVCFKLIFKWVYEGFCPNFFIPANNMFLGNIHGAAQKLLFIRLYDLYEKGFAFLLHSPSIRFSIITALYNLDNPFRTDEHILISEKEFDIELFTEIHKNDSICIYKAPLKSCLMYLEAIEQLLSAHSMTQYQILVLQKRTANILQNLAFTVPLHTLICASENKMRYRADKVSCHTLKLAAKFGCITDMLYIAMYYYKTFRFQKALSIIDVLKFKLSHPYVIYNSNVNARIYTETVGGQSLFSKMRHAVAEDITLENVICYVYELMPEQQSGLQNMTFFLTVRFFVLLHMIEILCCRHVDTMRAQIALNDLQTLVHYDQGQLLDCRDISWQILGICQQVTGNLQAALYSYQQSLRQCHLINRIQIATLMRIQDICQ
ncbi:uncharacterized protein LOC134269315 [Saccostrea cucullata]|uniref:uncharacterized protein LOC134269315 n=1 Tax=Saccostrea cuccullata TaxID=36930 RepID=UPI002ED4B7D1